MSIELLTGDAALAEAGALKPEPKRSPQYWARVAEVATIFGAAMAGNARAMLTLKESLSTSDFPNLLGTVFGRELLATYQQLPQVWSSFASRSVVNDFRAKTLVDLLGGRGILGSVAELQEYPARKPSEATYSLKVGKLGARVPLSWEMIVNDDLDSLRDLPNRLAQAARDTEDYTATAALVGGTGPLTAFWKSANGNAPITGAGSALTADSLTAALTAISTRKDSEGRPIAINGYVLMVPPALEVVANNIVNATEIRITQGSNLTTVGNWLRGKVTIVVNPWLTVIDTSGTAATTWYVLPAPNTSRPAVALGFLRGHETPDLRVKADTGNSLGGGSINPQDGSFDIDDIQYRIRHVLGSATLDPIGTYVAKGA